MSHPDPASSAGAVKQGLSYLIKLPTRAVPSFMNSLEKGKVGGSDG